MFEFDVPAGMKVAAGHSHDGYEETIYGLVGVLTWTIEGTPTDCRPRRRALHPPRRRPSVRKSARRDAQQPAIVTPGILGPDYFREVAAILAAAAAGGDRSSGLVAARCSRGVAKQPRLGVSA